MIEIKKICQSLWPKYRSASIGIIMLIARIDVSRPTIYKTGLNSKRLYRAINYKRVASDSN